MAVVGRGEEAAQEVRGDDGGAVAVVGEDGVLVAGASDYEVVVVVPGREMEAPAWKKTGEVFAGVLAGIAA